MRLPLLILALSAVAGCISPLPPVDPQKAWVDMSTYTGNLVMAEKLDNQRLNDGRYFQVQPGSHELQMRYDYELNYGGFGGINEPTEITCYITLRYDHFAPGQRYVFEGHSILNSVNGYLYDAQHKKVAEERMVTCLP